MCVSIWLTDCTKKNTAETEFKKQIHANVKNWIKEAKTDH